MPAAVVGHPGPSVPKRIYRRPGLAPRLMTPVPSAYGISPNLVPLLASCSTSHAYRSQIARRPSSEVGHPGPSTEEKTSRQPARATSPKMPQKSQVVQKAECRYAGSERVRALVRTLFLHKATTALSGRMLLISPLSRFLSWFLSAFHVPC